MYLNVRDFAPVFITRIRAIFEKKYFLSQNAFNSNKKKKQENNFDIKHYICNMPSDFFYV